MEKRGLKAGEKDIDRAMILQTACRLRGVHATTKELLTKWKNLIRAYKTDLNVRRAAAVQAIKADELPAPDTETAQHMRDRLADYIFQ